MITSISWFLILTSSTVAAKIQEPLQPDQSNFKLGNYKLWDAVDIKEKLDIWKEQYSDFIRVSTAQESFGLPRVGEAGDCPFDSGVTGCSNYFFTIQDFVTHPEGSLSGSLLPEVFWSGSLHGDESLGTTVVMEAASLLLEVTACESKPRYGMASSEREKNEARMCRTNLNWRGIEDEHRKWLARLVATRRIVIVPDANALGLYRDQSKENFTDPFEDFGYDKGNHCMETVAARTVNEIFRDHVFQIALLFQKGRGHIHYSWTTLSFAGQESPDNRVQSQVAEAYATELADLSPQVNNTLHSPYQRQGAVEDWAYAASWDFDRVQPCRPTAMGGYSEDKTTYNNSTHRAISIVVSTDIKNAQFPVELGNSLGLFSEDRKMHGVLLPSYLRLALVSADLVQPYVSIFSVDNLALSDDIVPLIKRSGLDCQITKSVAIPLTIAKMLVQWTVGGSLQISNTELLYARWNDVSQDGLDCFMQPRNLESAKFQTARIIGDNNGTGLFSPSGPSPRPEVAFAGKTLGPVFRAELDVVDFEVGDRIVLVARAKVDQDWKKRSEGDYTPKVDPQSHLANARTNPEWRHNNSGTIIEGRLDWYSEPIIVLVSDYDSRMGVIEFSDRLGSTHLKTSDKPQSSKSETLKFWRLWVVLLLALVLVGSIMIFHMYCRGGKIKGVLDTESNSEAHSPRFVATPSYEEKPTETVQQVAIFDETDIIDFEIDPHLEIIDFQGPESGTKCHPSDTNLFGPFLDSLLESETGLIDVPQSNLEGDVLYDVSYILENNDSTLETIDFEHPSQILDGYCDGANKENRTHDGDTRFNSTEHLACESEDSLGWSQHAGIYA